MNAQSLFGFAVMILLILPNANRRKSEHAPQPQRSERDTGARPGNSVKISTLAAGIGLLLLIAVAFWRSLFFYFLSDEFVLVKIANSFHREDLWATLTRAGGDGFFRPAGYISLWANACWSGYRPILWHISNLSLHAANSTLMFLVALRFCSNRGAAFLAALIFALHGSRPEAVIWTAARFDLLAAFFFLSAFLFFLRHYQTGLRSALLASMLGLFLALLSKETAYVFPLLLVLFLAIKQDFSRHSLRMLAPYWILTILLFVYRWTLLSGVGGYLNPRTGAPEFLDLGFISSLKALGLRAWAALFFPINWSVEPNFVLAFLLVANVGCLICLTHSRSGGRLFTFAAGFALLSALPAVTQLSLGADLQKSRLLYLPSAGFALLIALAVERLQTKYLRWLVASILVAFHLAALNHNLNIWRDVATLADRVCAAAAAKVSPATTKVIVLGLPGSLNGVYFFANGFPECVQMHAAKASDNVEVFAGPASAQSNSGTVVLVWDPVTQNLSQLH
ncbi:MAG TPA: hypothetical protein VGL91_03920 [Acidobacteriota bacterium]